MKLKATISLPGEHFSPDQRHSLANLVIATNSRELHEEIYEEVLRGHLHVADFGPAEYFTQMSDRMTRVIDNVVGFDVMLSGVSVTVRRAEQGFWDALDKMDEIYRRVASEHLRNDLTSQHFTRMGLDKPIFDRNRPGFLTPLPEVGPTLVEGSTFPREMSKEEVILAEMEALLGDERTVREFAALVNPERR